MFDLSQVVDYRYEFGIQGQHSDIYMYEGIHCYKAMINKWAVAVAAPTTCHNIPLSKIYPIMSLRVYVRKLQVHLENQLKLLYISVFFF